MLTLNNFNSIGNDYSVLLRLIHHKTVEECHILYTKKGCPIIVHKIIVHKKYLYMYARANCASCSLNFVNKNKNTCVSDNNPFAGKRMGRHINIKLLS